MLAAPADDEAAAGIVAEPVDADAGIGRAAAAGGVVLKKLLAAVVEEEIVFAELGLGGSGDLSLYSRP
jgi:hypothetical protein